MPVAKPKALHTRHATKAETADRASAESAVTPVSKLTLAVPEALKGHKQASAMWKWLIGLYFELDGQIVTLLDRDILIEYCLLDEEIKELEKLRAEIRDDYNVMRKTARATKARGENVKEVAHLWMQVNAIGTRFQGMDARLDGKRKHRLSLSQSLYLNPRSRAGVAPPTKEAPEEQDETEKLLNS